MGNGNGNGNGNGLNVLVVENNEDLAILLREQLMVHGCSVTMYTTSFERLLLPEAWTGVNAALVDMSLTYTDFGENFPVAFGILQYLGEHYPSITRVIYSAIPQYLLVNEGVAVQQLAHYVFSKPMRTEELVEALRG